MVDRTQTIRIERIESRIFFIRGYRVMLSPHLADIYQVEPRALVQAVNRIHDVEPEVTGHMSACHSPHPIATPKEDMDMIRDRLKVAEARAKEQRNEEATG